MHDPAAARRAGAGPRPVRTGRERERRPHRRRHRASRGRRHHRRRGDRTLHLDLAKPTCSTANIGRWNWPSSARARICRSPARSRSSPAPAAPSAPPPPAPSRRPAPKWRCSISMPSAAREKAAAIGGSALAVPCDVTDAASVRDAFDAGRRRVRRRRYRDFQCRRRLAGQDRRGRRGDFAPELRIEFLRASEGGAGRGEDHAGAGHRRLPVVQRIETGGEPGRQFRPLRPAQGGDLVPGAAIRARLRRRRHPRQCGQCRPHPLRPSHRRFHQAARQGARG